MASLIDYCNAIRDGEYSAVEGYIESGKFSVDEDLENDFKPIFMECKYKRHNIVKLLLEKDKDKTIIRTKNPLTKQNALHYILTCHTRGYRADSDELRCVQVLLEHGIDIYESWQNCTAVDIVANRDIKTLSVLFYEHAGMVSLKVYVKSFMLNNYIF